VLAVEHREINGGSLRFTIGRQHRPAHPSVTKQMVREARLFHPTALEEFAWRTEQRREQIQGLVGAAVKEFGFVDLYAASTKSSTLLQYCGLDNTVVRQAVERTQEKWGRVTTATRIPIVNEHTWRADPAPISLIGAWQFANVFAWREASYLADGGVFIVPLPSPRLMTHERDNRDDSRSEAATL
jgi:hypothetical protein